MKTEKIITELLEQMTLDEKIGMVHGNGLFQNKGVERLGIPSMKFSDGPMGVRNEFQNDKWIPLGNTDDYVSYLPSNSAIASTWDVNVAYEVGKVLGAEARGRGKDMILAPGINIKRSPLCGRNFEYLSEDPVLTAEMAVALIKGIQQNDVAACVKHFVANNQETNRLHVDTKVNERTLQEIYYPAFRQSVQKADVYSVMGAYNRLNGTYCCENNLLLKEVLRDQWGFEGIVISDWGAVHNTLDAGQVALDIEMSVFDNFDEYCLAEPLKQRILDESVDMACLEKYFNVTVITQNVDNLHERAGSSHVIHLHGELTKVTSTLQPNNPNYIKELKPEEFEVKIGDLAADGSQFRPFIVWFGESVPMIEKAIEYVETADVFLIIGTSLNVYPAAGLLNYVPRDVPVYLIDPKEVPIASDRKVYAIRKGASDGMEELKKNIGEIACT